MPKITVNPDFAGNPDVDAVRDDLQNELNKLSYLLEGRLDDTNLLAKLDGSTAYTVEIPSKAIVDGSDPTRPVDGCMKFYGYQGEGGTYSVTNTVWDRATALFYANKKLHALSGSQSWSITKETLETDWGATSSSVVTEYEYDYVYNSATKKGERHISSTKQINKQAKVYTRRITIPKPVNYKVYTYDKFFDDFGALPISGWEPDTIATRFGSPEDLAYYIGENSKITDPMITVTYSGAADFSGSNTVYCEVSSLSTSVSHEEVAVDLSFMAYGFDDDEYANIEVSVEVLCEVLP